MSPRPKYQLFRVDDRLLHGQVALGWGEELHPRHYVIADDAVAEDEVAREMYVAFSPRGTTLRVAFVQEMEAGDPPDMEPSRTVLLVRGLDAAARLLRAGVPGPLNLGGLHRRPGTRQVLPYLWLDDDDLRLLGALRAEGFEFEARDLPGTGRVVGERLLNLAREGV